MKKSITLMVLITGLMTALESHAKKIYLVNISKTYTLKVYDKNYQQVAEIKPRTAYSRYTVEAGHETFVTIASMPTTAMMIAVIRNCLAMTLWSKENKYRWKKFWYSCSW